MDYRDEEVSGLEAMLRRRKQLKTVSLCPPAPKTKMIWTKQNELLILSGILEYERETKLSYKSDWDKFYGYIKDLIDANFSKQQLMCKVKKLRMRFSDNIASGKSPDHDELFNLSIKIWTTNETKSSLPNHNIIMDQQQPKPTTTTSREIDNNGEEEFCLLQEALEEASSCFQTLSKYQQQLMLENLTPQKTKELTDEWKALLLEELHFNIKKHTFSLKLANA